MLQLKQSSLCGLHCSRDQEGGGPSWPDQSASNGQIVSIKRAADGRRQKSKKIIDEKREKYRAKNAFLWNTSTDLKGTTFVILINHASMPIRKERLSPTSKARREASRNEFVEKGRVPDRVKSFGEINSREDRLQTHLKWTKQGAEFDLESTIQGGNRPGGEREWN